MGSTTRYFPGGAATEVQAQSFNVPSLSMPNIGGGAAGGGFGFPDLSSVFAERQRIEAEREARAARMQALQMKAMQQQMADSRGDRKFADNERYNASRARANDAGYRGKVQDLQLRAMTAENAAMENPQPLKWIGGPGYEPGYTPDTLKMNAYQRRNFLPGNSANAPDRDAVAENVRNRTGEEGFDNFKRETALRRQVDAKGGY